ncbi:MAG: 50S ribosomal protein L17 [Phycisphaerales bacterium]|nr:50S ribosomal protein L17 [Phycisphaerales bacterium]
MRHLVARRKLNRTSEHREALRRNMAQSLFEHGQITTTLPKAKDLRPFAERLITLARKAHQGSLAARQRLTALLGDRAVIPKEYQEQYDDMSDAARARVLRSRSGRRHRLGQAKGGMKFTATSIVHHLITNVAPNYMDRAGGYTRVITLGKAQKGDSTPKAIIQLVGREESPGTVTRPEKTARRRRTERRYAMAAKAIKRRPIAESSGPVDKPAAPENTGSDEQAPQE